MSDELQSPPSAQPHTGIPASFHFEPPQATLAASESGLGIGINRSLLLCLSFLAVFMFSSFAVGLVAGFVTASSGGSINLMANLFAMMVVPQILAWIVTIRIGLRWLDLPFRVASSVKVFPASWLPALAVTSFGATILLAELISWIPMPEAWREYAAGQRDGNGLLWLFFPVVIVAPVAEEIFFRGLLLRGYLEKYSISKAIWASALLFALFHLNPWQATFAFPLGVWYAWLAIQGGSVLPGIISHAVVNASLNYLLGPLALLMGYSVEEIRNWRHYPLPMLAVGAACVAIAGWIHFRQLKNLSATASEEPPPPETGTPVASENTLVR